MTSELLEQEEIDVPSLIRGRPVCLSGRPASMTKQEFIDLLEANGAQYTPEVMRGVAVVVVGQKDWPVTVNGTLPIALRDAHRLIRHERSRMKVISEDQFLAALGLDAYRENVQRRYTLSTLTELIGVSRDRIRAWVVAGLIRPAKVEYGVWYFEFRQVTAAKRLSELLRSGVSLRRLRASLEQLRRWLPDAHEPLEQLAIFEKHGDLIVRMEDGDLSAADGQLQFDFSGSAEPPSLKLVTGPQTALEWFDLGLEQEQAGYLEEAVESYRQSLLTGGPDARCCFNLANALKALGQKDQALERYRQAVEIDGRFADAWNNLGILLAELGHGEDACSAFRKVLAIDPDDLRAHYNLADALDEVGRKTDAIAHWRAYLRQDSTSRWAAYARERLAAS